MSIEINGRTPPHTGGTGERVQLRAVPDEAPAKTPRDAAGTSSSDTVSLTGRAAFLQRLDAAIAAQPVTDEHRISTVRQKIDSDNYAIDPARVAEKLIEVETALTRATDGKDKQP